jgi:four helix bundle protein
MTKPFKSHRELKVWQKGLELVVVIYQITKNFPSSEIYGLTNQLRRASVSVPSNIAEGHARNSTKEFLHFLSIAVASLSEIDTQLEIAKQLKFIDSQVIDETSLKVEELARMIHGLRRSLQQKLNDN